MGRIMGYLTVEQKAANIAVLEYFLSIPIGWDGSRVIDFLENHPYHDKSESFSLSLGDFDTTPEGLIVCEVHSQWCLGALLSEILALKQSILAAFGSCDCE